MKNPRPALLVFLLAVSICVVLAVGQAHAESYIAAQIGLTLPQSLGDVNVGGPGPGGVTSSDLEMKNSFLYGAKVGHYFDSFKWLGLETEFFITTPHIK
jgi:hypothetical protein